MDRPLRVAVVGAGPAGVYVADVLHKSGTPVSVDMFEKLPAPYGLIRYGVAPDHPRIKGIITALRQIMSRDTLRLFGNVEYGVDIKLEDLQRHYDAVVFTTGDARSTNRVRGSLAGCDAYLTKPLLEDELIAALRDVDPLFR